MFKLLEAEFVAYRKGDKAEGYIANESESCYRRGGGKADAFYPEPAEAVGTYEYAGNEVCRNCWQLKWLGGTGHEKPGDECYCNA